MSDLDKERQMALTIEEIKEKNKQKQEETDNKKNILLQELQQSGELKIVEDGLDQGIVEYLEIKKIGYFRKRLKLRAVFGYNSKNEGVNKKIMMRLYDANALDLFLDRFRREWDIVTYSISNKEVREIWFTFEKIEPDKKARSPKCADAPNTLKEKKGELTQLKKEEVKIRDRIQLLESDIIEEEARLELSESAYRGALPARNSD